MKRYLVLALHYAQCKRWLDEKIKEGLITRPLQQVIYVHGIEQMLGIRLGPEWELIKLAGWENNPSYNLDRILEQIQIMEYRREADENRTE